MRWDDPYFFGQRGNWHWIVSREEIHRLRALTLCEHLGSRLWITTFDSGVLTLGGQDAAEGWLSVDGALVSPPIRLNLDYPSDHYDEWYIFADATPRHCEFEQFINYGGFTLADPRTLAESFDPTWERSGLDWLYPIQERFWNHLDAVDPISYIGMGSNDIVVTRAPKFADAVRKLVQQQSTMG